MSTQGGGSDGSSSEIGAGATIAADSTGPPTATETTPPGEVLSGRWEILGMLGVGGMGTVYRARDRELREVVALKMLHGASLDELGLERFRTEVRLSRKVTHKNVARVYELGEHKGQRFFTMELVEGESLRSLLDRTGAQSQRRAVEIAIWIARGLGAAHEVGVVHRDLKPDNVLMREDGRIAITDFGIASSIEPGGEAKRTTSFVGTPMYMAPEQVDRQHAIDARTDLYALGAVLYELLTGEGPFEGPTPLAIAAARLRLPPPDPRIRRADVLTSLSEIVVRCMAREPSARPASAHEVELALEGVSSEIIASMSPPPIRSLGAAVTPSMLGSGALAKSPFTAFLGNKAQRRLAVLPIENGLGDEASYLAEGFTDDLIDGLSTARKLQVLSRSVVLQYSGRRDVDARAVGNELGVDVVAQGSLRRVGKEKVRVSLRLISTADGLQLWSKRYDISETELLDVSDEAATAIADALTVEAPRIGRKLSDPHAVDLYLRARAAFREFSPDGCQRAIDLFEEAFTVVPEDPLLMAGYAMALARLTFFTGVRHEHALEIARRAVELAPDSAEANLAVSSALLQMGRVAEALRSALTAVSLAPSLAEAHQWVGRILAEAGPLDLAIRFLDTAYELEPTHGLGRIERARALSYLGRYDEALITLGGRGTPGIDRVGQYLAHARVSLWRGDIPSVLSAARELTAIADEVAKVAPMRASIARRFAQIADLQAPLPSPEEMSDVLKAPNMSTRRDIFIFQIMAESAAYRGDLDRALALMKQSVDLGLRDLVWMDRCPLFSSIRERQAFAELRSIVEERASEIRAVLPEMRGVMTKHSAGPISRV